MILYYYRIFDVFALTCRVGDNPHEIITLYFLWGSQWHLILFVSSVDSQKSIYSLLKVTCIYALMPLCLQADDNKLSNINSISNGNLNLFSSNGHKFNQQQQFKSLFIEWRGNAILRAGPRLTSPCQLHHIDAVISSDKILHELSNIRELDCLKHSLCS